jgi:hypothetical protein
MTLGLKGNVDSVFSTIFGTATTEGHPMVASKKQRAFRIGIWPITPTTERPLLGLHSPALIFDARATLLKGLEFTNSRRRLFTTSASKPKQDTAQIANNPLPAIRTTTARVVFERSLSCLFFRAFLGQFQHHNA